jgi:hypothetical protein
MSSCKKYKPLSIEDMDNACEQLFVIMQDTSQEAPPDSEANAAIDEYTTILVDTMKNFGVGLNVDEFRRLLTNIYTNLSSSQSSLLMKGGGPLQITGSKSYALTHFKAFAALLTSLILLYLAYNILNGLTCTLTGESVLKYPELAFKDVFTTVEEMTFLQYVWRSVSTLSSNVVGLQTSYVTRILQMNIHIIIPDMTAIVNETCMPPTKGLLGNAGQYLAGIMTPQITSDCIVDTSAELARQFLAAQEGKLALLAIQTKTSFAQVIMLTRVGLGIGAASVGYFTTVLTMPSSRLEAIDEGDQRFLEGGKSRKRKRTRNNKRPRTTRRNYRL